VVEVDVVVVGASVVVDVEVVVGGAPVDVVVLVVVVVTSEQNPGQSELETSSYSETQRQLQAEGFSGSQQLGSWDGSHTAAMNGEQLGHCGGPGMQGS
jgi:hypothetical protein